MSEELITVAELEKFIYEFEEVRVIFRTWSAVQVKKYPYKNQIGDQNSIYVLKERLENSYPSIPFVIVDGSGIIEHLRSKRIGHIRQQYHQ